MSIHPTALLDSAVRLGEGVRVGPYAVIEGGVEVGDGSKIAAHAVIRSGVIIGRETVVDSHAVVGGLPQDPRFDPMTPSGVRIGDGVVLREGVTVHRSTAEGGFTSIGDGAYIMAYAHVAHDCRIGERAILANNVMLAGHIDIGAHAFLGGGAAFHQFVRVGESSMISGMSRVSRDAPPFSMVAERDELIGLNLVGLRRRSFDREVIVALKEAFRELFDGKVGATARARELLETPVAEVAEVRRLLEFLCKSKRGLVQLRRGQKSLDRL